MTYTPLVITCDANQRAFLDLYLQNAHKQISGAIRVEYPAQPGHLLVHGWAHYDRQYSFKIMMACNNWA